MRCDYCGHQIEDGQAVIAITPGIAGQSNISGNMTFMPSSSVGKPLLVHPACVGGWVLASYEVEIKNII